MRKEPRFNCATASTFILTTGAAEPVAGTVSDVSRSGIRMQLQSSVPVGATARLELDQMVVNGTIRYCKPGTHLMFDAGLEIVDVVDSRRQE